MRVDITLDYLRTVMPLCPPLRATECLPYIRQACEEFHVHSRMRVAAFLAQLAHESGELRFFEELADGLGYEGRTDLGNIKPGDGPRYKGRGPIQLTGRRNYYQAGKDLLLPLEAEPFRVATPEVGFRVAGWFWASRNCNTLADRGAFDEITRAVNGGMNHWRERVRYYARAL